MYGMRSRKRVLSKGKRDMSESNQQKLEKIDFKKELLFAFEDGMNFDSNPVDIVLHIFERANLKISKKRLEQLHRIRDYCEEEYE